MGCAGGDDGTADAGTVRDPVESSRGEPIRNLGFSIPYSLFPIPYSLLYRHSCSQTRTIRSPLAWRKPTTRESSVCPAEQNPAASTVDSGTVMVQGRGNEDLMTPAIMLAISLVASRASASATLSSSCIIIAAVAW